MRENPVTNKNVAQIKPNGNIGYILLECPKRDFSKKAPCEYEEKGDFAIGLASKAHR